MLGVVVDTVGYIGNVVSTCTSACSGNTTPKNNYARNESLSTKVDSVTSSVLRDTVMTGISYGALTLYSKETQNLLCTTAQLIMPGLSKLNSVSTYINLPSSLYYCNEAFPYVAQALKAAQIAKIGFLFARTALKTHENTGEIIKDVVNTASHCFQLYQAEQLLK